MVRDSSNLTFLAFLILVNYCLFMRIVLLSTGNDEDFAIVLFEDENMNSVVETTQTKEPRCVYNQTINVLWGKGKDVEYFFSQTYLMWFVGLSCNIVHLQKYVTTCFTAV